MEEDKQSYWPDVATPPGDTLAEALQLEFANRIGISEQTMNGIIEGKKPITPEIAIKLEQALNIPASFWNNLENNFRADLIRIAGLKQK